LIEGCLVYVILSVAWDFLNCKTHSGSLATSAARVARQQGRPSVRDEGEGCKSWLKESEGPMCKAQWGEAGSHVTVMEVPKSPLRKHTIGGVV
jgi:hypothetical protein